MPDVSSTLAAISIASFALGSACNLSGAIPQFIRTSLRGRIAGLAPGALAMSLGINLLWLGYGISLGDTKLIALQLFALTLVGTNAVRFWSIRGTDPTLLRLAALVALAAAAVTAATVTGQHGLLTAAGVVTNLIGAAPQLLFLRRLADGADTTGIAVSSLFIGLTGASSWFVYWALEGNWPIALATTGNLLCVSTTLILLFRIRRATASAVASATSGTADALLPAQT